MKKLALILTLVVATCLQSFGQVDPDDGRKLGLISYLTYVKTVSEFKMLELMTNPQYKLQPTKAKGFNSNYNLIKLAIDKLINQLSADSYQKNGLGLYKALNLYLKEGKALPGKYKAYGALFDEIQGRQSSFMLKTYSSINGASVEEITGIVELAIGTVTSARDFREKKVQSITGLVKELRLEKISALTKPEEKKE